MIEKIELDEILREIPNTESRITRLALSINELVDAVNEQQKQIDKMSCAILDLATPDGENKALKSIQAALDDPYAEQRKWLGKLCKFWDYDGEEDKVIGVLTGVFDEADRPFERNIDQALYKHCEPVKPDDDIIFKGE